MINETLNGILEYEPDLVDKLRLINVKSQDDNIRLSLNILLFYNFLFNKSIESTEFILKYFDVNNCEEYHKNMELIEDKHSYGLNGTLDLLGFYSSHYQCRTSSNKSIDCSSLRPTVKMLSPFGECQTYLSYIGSPHENKSHHVKEVFTNIVELIEHRFDNFLANPNFYLKRKFIIHSPNSLPIWSTNEIYFTDFSKIHNKDFNLVINKFSMTKLPPPYDTGCMDYDKINQFECLDNCIAQYYYENLNCTPSYNSFHTIILNENFINNPDIFCSVELNHNISKLNSIFKPICERQCGDPCDDLYYEYYYEDVTFSDFYDKTYSIIFENNYYYSIKYIAKTTMFNLLINVANILSLWHGLSFFDIIFALTYFKTIITRIDKLFKKCNLKFKLKVSHVT